MTLESHLLPLTSLLIAIGTFLYMMRSKAREAYVQILEYRINDLTQKETTCRERLDKIEQINADLLLRLAGVRPLRQSSGGGEAMQNPKTTLAGYASLLGTLLVLVGQVIPESSWGTTLTQLGMLLNGGGASIGIIAAKDGGH